MPRRVEQLADPLSLTRFDLPSFVLEAFAELEVKVDLLSKVTIGEYQTALTYEQYGVPAHTDETLTVSISARRVATRA